MTRPEMVFFDVETTAHDVGVGRWCLLEFGAIVVCPRKLVEVASYHTLIRPDDLSTVSKRFTDDANVDVASAPPFRDVADDIFAVLNGRVWAGHNIQRFDCPRIRDAFADIGRPAPEPVAVVDSLNVLASDFGRRAGDLKMATLATYFGIGKQKHRSLDDARMNLEVLKHCATVLLLESTIPAVLRDNAGAGAVTTRRRKSTGTTMSSTATSTTTSLMRAHKTPCPTSLKLHSPAASPAGAAASASHAEKTNGSCKRDNVGKVVSGGSRRAKTTSTTTPFHMILRHSRAIVR